MSVERANNGGIPSDLEVDTQGLDESTRKLAAEQGSTLAFELEAAQSWERPDKTADSEDSQA